jgi:hypothetical protein
LADYKALTGTIARGLHRMMQKTAKKQRETKPVTAPIPVAAPVKVKGKIGGRRPGAGRKPDYFKRLGITPLTAAQILQRYDEREAWHWFLKHKNPAVRFKAWEYLTDRRDGKPKQAVDLSGTLNHAVASYRDPRLAGLSDDELAALDGLTRKLLPAVPDAPENQQQSTSAEAEIPSPLPEPGEQKRETTFPMAIANGLRTQPTGGAGAIIEIPASEPQPDGAA